MEVIQRYIVNFLDELWEKIFAKLPIASILRTRAVCKRFKEIVDSESFKVIHSLETPHNILFLPFENEDCFKNGVSALCSEANRWYTIPFSKACLSLNPSSIICAGGTFLVIETPKNDIVVYNMITKTHTILVPMLPLYRHCSARAIVAFNSGHYKVLAQTCEGHYQLYDSENYSWGMSIKCNTPLSACTGSAYLNGLLYILSFDLGSLIAIDILGDRVGNVVQKNLPNGLIEPFVMEHEGLLLLLGGIQENRVLKSINIWQLHEMEWHILSTMLNRLLRGLQSPKEICVRIIGMGGKICFFKKKYSSRPCMFHLSTGKWVEKLPSCPNPRGHRLTWMGIAIEPRLHMEIY